MMTRGLGCRRDTHDHRDRLALSRVAQLPQESRLWERVPRSRDQGQTSSCVGHGVVGALELYRILSGKPDIPLSPVHCYDLARLADMMPGEQLTDDGAMIRSGMKVVSALGVCPEAELPLDPLRINARPPLAVDISGVTLADTPYERLTDVPSILGALVDGPVVVGLNVTQRYMDHMGNDPIPAPDSTDTFLGGHCIYLAGFRSGGAEIFQQGQWGPSWGFDYQNAAGQRIYSAAWLDAGWLSSQAVGDAWRFHP